MSEPTVNILAVDCGTLRSDLIVSRQMTAQGKRVLLRSPDTGKTFLFSEGAFRVLESLRAGRSARVSIAATFSNGLENAPGTVQLVASAHAAGLLRGGQIPAVDAKPEGIVQQAARFNPFYIRIPIVDPQPLVRMLRPVARIVFHPWTLRLWVVAIVVLAAAVAFSWTRYGWELVIFLHFGWWPVLYAALAVSAIIHEISHVMMCDRFGVAVKQVGILFYFLNPGAYADVSGAWMLPERRQRISIALAGLYVESMLLIFSAAFWLLSNVGALHEIAFVFGLCLFARIAVNLVPFLRLDGYWVLADAMGMPNLRSSAFRYLRSQLPGGPGRELQARVNKTQAVIFLMYGSGALICLGAALTVTVRHILSLANSWITGPILLFLLVLAGLNVGVRIGAWKPRNNAASHT